MPVFVNVVHRERHPRTQATDVAHNDGEWELATRRSLHRGGFRDVIVHRGEGRASPSERKTRANGECTCIALIKNRARGACGATMKRPSGSFFYETYSNASSSRTRASQRHTAPRVARVSHVSRVSVRTTTTPRAPRARVGSGEDRLPGASKAFEFSEPTTLALTSVPMANGTCGPPLVSPRKPPVPSRLGVGRYSDEPTARAGRWSTLGSLQTRSGETQRDMTRRDLAQPKPAALADVRDSRSQSHTLPTTAPPLNTTITPPLHTEAVTWAKRIGLGLPFSRRYHNPVLGDEDDALVAQSVDSVVSNRASTSLLDTRAGDGQREETIFSLSKPTVSTSPFTMRDTRGSCDVVRDDDDATATTTMTKTKTNFGSDDAREDVSDSQFAAAGRGDRHENMSTVKANLAAAFSPLAPHSNARFTEAFSAVLDIGGSGDDDDDVITAGVDYESDMDGWRYEACVDEALSGLTKDTCTAKETPVKHSSSWDAVGLSSVAVALFEPGASSSKCADVPNIRNNDAYVSDDSPRDGYELEYAVDSSLDLSPSNSIDSREYEENERVFSREFPRDEARRGIFSPSAVRAAAVAVDLFHARRNEETSRVGTLIYPADTETEERRRQNASAFVALRKSVETNSPRKPKPVRVVVAKQKQKRSREEQKQNLPLKQTESLSESVGDPGDYPKGERWVSCDKNPWPPLPCSLPDESVEEEFGALGVVSPEKKISERPASAMTHPTPLSSSKVWAAICAAQGDAIERTGSDAYARVAETADELESVGRVSDVSDVAAREYALMLARADTLHVFDGGEGDTRDDGVHDDEPQHVGVQCVQRFFDAKTAREKENRNTKIDETKSEFGFSGVTNSPKTRVPCDETKHLEKALSVLEEAMRAALAARAAVKNAHPGVLKNLDAKLGQLRERCVSSTRDGGGVAGIDETGGEPDRKQQPVLRDKNSRRVPREECLPEECFPPAERTRGNTGAISGDFNTSLAHTTSPRHQLDWMESSLVQRAMARVVEKCLRSYGDGIVAAVQSSRAE